MQFQHLDQILSRLENGAALAPADFHVIRAAIADLSKLHATLKALTPVGSRRALNVTEITADFGHFRKIPIYGAQYIRVGSSQSIPNDTETPITFTNTEDTNSYFRAQIDRTKIDLKANTPERKIGIMGVVNFASNGTGRRAAHLNAYDIGDTQVFGATLFSQLPTGLTTDVFAFAAPFYPIGAHHLKFTVLQTSGGSLGVPYVSLELFVLE